MSLALHQLRHEFRRSHVFVAVYLVILFGHFAVAAGWIGQPEYNARYEGWGNENVLPGFIAMAFWITLTLLVMGITTADSPSNKDRLLATRPFPRRSLIVAKALFITLALLLPAAVLEFLALRIINAPGHIIAIGTIEHFGLLAIYCAFIALFSAHWRSSFIAKLAFAITIGLASAFIGSIATLLDFITRLKGIDRLRMPEPTLLTAALSTVVICIGLAITLRLHTRRQWTVRRLILPFAGLTVLWFALAMWIPIHTLTLPGSEQDTVTQVFGANSDTIAFAPERIRYNQHNQKVVAEYNLVPQASVHPDDWEIRWKAERTTWLHDGSEIHRDRPHRRWINSTVITPDNAPLSPALMHTLRKHAPGFRFLVTDRSHQPRTTSRMEAGELRYAHGETPRGSLEIETEIAAAAARWSLAADLPFHTKIPVESGPWRLAGVQTRDSTFAAYVTLRTPRLHTATDPSIPSSTHEWTGNVLFALHVPARKLVWIANSHYTQWVPTFSSAAQTFGELRFESHSSSAPKLDGDDLPSARLLIFQAEHLGTVSRDYRSPKFSLKSRAGEEGAALAAIHRPHEPESSPAAFALWLTGHENLPADLPATELREHLDDLFNRERRSGAYLEYPHSPAVNHLARFVPHHRDLFMESIHGITSQTSASRLAIKALTQGASENDKTTIIAALADTPILIETIIDRGWIDDARDEIIALLRSHPTDLDALRSVLSFDDPELDDLLLDSFRKSRSAQVYKALRPIPRLRERLDTIASDQWSPGLMIINDNLVDPRLELALHEGRTDALAHFFEVLPMLGTHGSSSWKAADVAEMIFLLPESLRPHRHDSDRVLGWLRSQNPKAFRFDPVLQRFVLTANNSI